MFVRFQFASTTFAELVRDQVSRSVPAVPPTGSGFIVERIAFPEAGPQPVDVDHSGELVMADASAAMAHVFGPSFPFEVVPNPYETITIPVVDGAPISVKRRRLLLTLPVALRIHVLDNFIAGTGEPLVITIDVRLRIDLVHRTDGDFIRVEYDGITHREGNNQAVEDLIGAELAAAGIAREAEFPYTEAVLAALASMGGGVATPGVVWSGMTLSPDRQTVELRVEVGFDDLTGTADPDAWRQFLGRQIDDYRTGHDWAVEMTRDLLDVSVTAGAREQVIGTGGFRLAGTGPHVEWRPDFPGFRTTFTGEIIDACSCFGVDIDLNVAVEVTTRIALTQAGSTATIEVDSVTVGDPTHAGEQACCAFTSAAVWPILGWKYLDEGKIGWGGLALGFFVPIFGGLYTMWKLFDPSPEAPLAEGCRKEGDHQICTHQLSLEPEADPCVPPSAFISIDQLRGRNNGLVLAGGIRQVFHGTPEIGITEPTPFEWVGPRATCTETVGDWSAHSTFTVTQDGGGFPLQVYEVRPVGPAAPILRTRIVRTTTCPSTAEIEITTLPWTIGGPPAPLLVLTNVGAKVVMTPPLPPLTDEKRAAYERWLVRWRLRACVLYDPELLERTGRITARWTVDTPAGGGPTRRLWVIRAAGLEPGELLVVNDAPPEHSSTDQAPLPSRPPSGTELAVGTSDGRRGVWLDLLHDGEGLEITRRRPSGEPGGPLADAKVSIAEVLLEQVDERRLPRPADSLRAIDDPTRPAIAVRMDGRYELLPVDQAGTITDSHRGWRAPPRADATRLAIADRAGAGAGTGAPGRAERYTSRYRDRPWFDGMAQVGQVIARLDDDRTTLCTYRVAATATL